MNLIISPHTYQPKALHKTILTRGALTFLLLVLCFALVIETTSRLFYISKPFPSLGSDSFLFDYKIHALENQVRHEGQLDCLILGSSVANGNLDPDVLATAYQQQNGETIRCFNLGIPALTVETAIPIAEAAIRRYSPKVILFILIPRDLVDREYTVDHLAKNPWVTYQRGQVNISNWFTVNSYSLRYFLTWQYWQTNSNRAKMSSETNGTTSRGFSRVEGIRQPYPPDWLMDAESLQKVWKDEKTRPTLDNLLGLKEHSLKFIFIEAPAYSVANPEAANPAGQIYEQDYIANLEQYLAKKDVPFWRVTEITSQIPRENWYDWLHLNVDGAETFSAWAGRKLAEYKDYFK